MKILLFCENKYAVDILKPIHDEAMRENLDGESNETLWFVDARKITKFPLSGEVRYTNSIQECHDWRPEAVFVPGNIVPYYLSGVKIQVFHGYAAEKKDHWIIRRYFDTYFTQGPYFTSHFEASARRYGDFEVLETGWTKQDWIYRHLHDYDAEKQKLLEEHGKKHIVLYAPTFSPKLTSLPRMRNALEQLLRQRDVLLIMKFHPLTKREWCDEYRAWAATQPHALYVESGENVTRYQMMSDVMLSDTSSAVYEFLLLNRPVITLNTIAKDIYWDNITDPAMLVETFDKTLTDEESIAKRRWIVENYDPHLDGLCCKRMLDGARDYIKRHGVPEKRRLNLWRKYTSIKTFGRVKNS